MNTIEAFKDWLTINYGTEKSVNTHLSKIRKFFSIYQEFNQENVNGFLGKLIADNKEIETFNGYLKGFIAYQRFSEITVKLPKFKKPHKKIKPHIEEKKFEEIINYVPFLFPKDFNEVTAILQFLFYTGCRKEEMTNLKKSDINFTDGTILISETKNRKDRKVFLPERILEQIKKHIERQVDSDKVFNITDDRLYYIFEKINNELNLNPRIHPHMLRRSLATMLYKKSRDAYLIKDILGHANLSQTLDYTNLDTETMKQSYRKYIK